MKRPLLGTLSILALLGGGVFLAMRSRDAAQQPLAAQNACFEGAAARQRFRRQFDVSLPNAAENVHYCSESLDSTQLIFVSFDVSPVELPGLFGDQSRLPDPSELKADPGLVGNMAALAAPQRPWWNVGELKNPQAAQKSGKSVLASTAIKWRAQVCAATLSASATRVYVAISEEPQGEP